MEKISATSAITEFIEVFRDAGPTRWRTMLASAAITGFLFWALTHESWRGPPPRPTITYINSWPLTRSTKQTRDFIMANQKFNDARAKEQAEADEKMRQMYKAVGRASGMDVDRIERDAKADAAAKAKASATTPQAPVAQH